ncbi:MAG: ABC transporter substrate-binding protein [Desulfobacterales bacterium]|jgi:NitT/TauT family transport system substrate-binding protein
MITKIKHIKSMGIGLLILLLIMAGVPANLSAQSTRSLISLKVALLPILDTLPFHAAQAKGYFDRYGVTVTAVPVGSGLERDQLMQSGAIDGMLNEMGTTANFNRDQVQVRVILSARKAYPHYPLFRVLSAPGSGLSSPADLKGIPIGVSKNTIIEYVTDRLLAANGLTPNQIAKKSVPVIPERFQLLLQGQLKAATLPDPLAKSALQAGAGAVIDDSTHPQYSVSVLSFTIQALKVKADAVRGFIKAWNQAAQDINADPESYRSLLLQKIRVPKNIQQTYRIPPFPFREIPSAEQWADVMNWMVSKGLLKAPLPYKESITTQFLR